MAFEVLLPGELKAAGWKVKIRDKERVEPPHVTVIRRTRSWRWGLREREFLDSTPPPRDVPEAVLAEIEAGYADLCRQWNAMYPENPVSSEVSDE
jgi:hypothetical protein